MKQQQSRKKKAVAEPYILHLYVQYDGVQKGWAHQQRQDVTLQHHCQIRGEGVGVIVGVIGIHDKGHNNNNNNHTL